jgi:phosphatidate cytidylyltransferase
MEWGFHRHVAWSLAVIYLLLLVANLYAYLAARKRPGPSAQELKDRVRTWVYIILFFTVAAANRGTAILGFAFISYQALKEYLSLIPTRQADRHVLFWVYLSVPVQYYWIWDDWYGMFIIWIPVYLFLFIPLLMVLVGHTRGFLQAVGTLHWGIMVTVFSLSHLAYLVVLPEPETLAVGGAGLMLYLVVLTQGNDISQFIYGKTFGKRKVAPRISPNKTWAGLIGGLAMTMAVAVLLAPPLTPMNLWHSLGAGLIIGLGGFFGDLTMSALKRDLGIKDTSNALPGHGGVLDRVDSLIFTAPLFLHYIRYCYY